MIFRWVVCGWSRDGGSVMRPDVLFDIVSHAGNSGLFLFCFVFAFLQVLGYYLLPGTNDNSHTLGTRQSRPPLP